MQINRSNSPKKIVIIGAGIVGASTGYQLAKKGAEVIIVDRHEQGQATDAAAGIICPWLSQRRNKAWYKLAKGGAAIYPKLVEELANDGETDTGYARVGAISLHTDEKKQIAMRDRALKRRDDAPEIGKVTLLDQKETKRRFPLLSEEYSSIHVSGAARVNGRKLRNALLRGAKKHGGKLIEGDATILHEGSTVTGVSVDENILKADTVIATTGVWMRELLKPLDIEFDVTPQRAQIMHLKMPDTDTSKWPVVMPPTDQYMLTLDDSRIVIGATHENNVGLDHRITAGGVYEILTKAITIAPELENSTVLETRVGFRPVTPGFLPVIGPLPSYQGLLLANGLGSSGLTMGPFIGKQLAKLALDEQPDIDINNYDVAGALQ